MEASLKLHENATWEDLTQQLHLLKSQTQGFPHSSVDKESACSAGDPASIPGLGRSPGEGNGNPLQYSCLENPIDRGAWQVTVDGVARVRHDLVSKPPPPNLARLWNACQYFSSAPGLKHLTPKRSVKSENLIFKMNFNEFY